VYVESNIEFDFTKAHSVIEYETLLTRHPGASPTQRNTFWPGIDFQVEESPGDAIWLEVKSWNPASVPPKDRGGSRRSFWYKMRSERFAGEMRGKFLGASAFFLWENVPLPSNVRFLLVFEPPHPIDTPLVLAFGHKVKQQMMPPRVLPWRRRIDVGALTLAEWNARFPDYPAVHK
jgi:hypothetical protein